MKILLLDDEASHRLLELRAIKKQFPGADVSTCATLDEARAALISASPSIAIIDLNIAGLSGLKIVKQIRENSPLSSLPIIVLSTSQLALDVEQSYAAGASAYLFKSDNPQEFVLNLQSAVRFLTA